MNWRFYQLWGHVLWAVFFVISIVVAIVMLIMQACGCGATNPTQTAARTAAFVMRALCSDDMTVKECGDLLEERAGYLESDAGAE